MFKPDKPLPPPPSAKSRNESLAAHMPSYRSRPAPSANDSSGFSFSNTKSLFESLNKPQVRSVVVNVAKNPTVQRATIAAAKDERVQSFAIRAAKDPEIRQTASNYVQSPAGRGTIREMAKEFESKPLMGFAPPSPNAPSQPTTNWNNQSSLTPQREQLYPSLTGDSSWNKSSRFSNDFSHSQNRPRSTEPDPSFNALVDELFPIQPKKQAPARPPPPKLGSKSVTNLSAISNSAHSFEPTILDPHGVAKYPYKTDKHDELNCEPGDTILLKREVDDQWIFGTNTKTGRSGIVPINFLHIKIPLVPTASRESNIVPSWDASPETPTFYGGNNVSSMSHSTSAYTGFMSSGRHIARALYDYESNVEGDLCFRAGEIIYITERVDDEWLKGECNFKTGIFPVNYVDIPNLDSIPKKGKTGNPLADSFSKLSFKPKFVTALYNYCSGIPEDLVFETGDVIQILEEVNGEWIKGSLDGRVGLVPLTYVERNE
uniref:SH3 domain-containing protein n=1 Tax=Panagrolaimus sp. JU765 TaxID=591449 RepID=A0AC34PW85_9BILA